MRLKKIKKTINIFYKKWKFLKESNIKIRLVYDDPKYYIGMFSTTYNKSGVIECFINLNLNWFLVNDKRLLNFVIKHEIVHALDYVIHGGWRIDSETQKILEHDSVFCQLCKNINIPSNHTPFFPINKQFKSKRYNNIPIINMDDILSSQKNTYIKFF